MQISEARLHKLNEAFGWGQRPHQAPDSAFVHEAAITDRAKHELAQEQDVAAAMLDEAGDHGGVDLAAEFRAQQVLDCLRAKAPDLDPIDEVVLPQTDDGRWGLFAGADRRHNEGRVSGDQLADQRGRGII
jgi:hypothetical protein